MRALTCPTRRCTITSGGMITSEISVRRQSIRIIATSDAMTVTVLPRMLVTVVVSTPETPPTSFCSRDWMAPVFVRVKKPSSIDCRCSNIVTRRSPVTRFPTFEVNHVCRALIPELSMYSAIMVTTSQTSSGTCTIPDVGNRASSNTR